MTCTVKERFAQYSYATYHEMDGICGWYLDDMWMIGVLNILMLHIMKWIGCVDGVFHNKYFWGVKESVIECFCPLNYLFDKCKMYIAFKLLPHRLDNCAKNILANSKTRKSSLANWLNQSSAYFWKISSKMFCSYQKAKVKHSCLFLINPH